MAAKEMYDYLSVVSPDYSSTTMELSPQKEIEEIGEKNVIIHTADDISEERIALSNDSIFEVTLKWASISESDAGTLIDFYHDTAKGNGSARSFKWTSLDGHTYVVRFAAGVPRSIGAFSRHTVSVTLRILGKAS